MRGEFHIHTTASDGVYSLKQILENIKGKEEYFSITDHDILTNSYMAINLAPKYNLNAILGVEVSSKYKEDNVHILGYFKTDANLEKLEKVLTDARNNRVQRLYKISDKLKEYFNIELDLTDLLKINTITRGSIARAIISQGYPYTTTEIFDKMIGSGCPAYIPSSKVSTMDAISLIHECGGKAVLAHPTLLKHCDPIEIIEMGVDGIEAIYPLNKDGEEEIYRALAKKYNLFISAGSDFHAPHDPRHGELTETCLEDEELERFLKEVL